MQTAIELLYDLESRLIANITRALAKGDIGTAYWSMQKLEDLGTVHTLNSLAVKDHLERVLPLIREEIRKRGTAAAEGIDRTLEGLQLSEVLPVNADPALKAIFQTWEGSAQTTLEKLGATLLSGARDIYVDTINRTVSQVLAGHITGRQAIADTAREWSEAGIPALVDTRGRKWTTEAYSTMVVRSTVRNVVTDTQAARCQSYGVDLVEVSSHLGARPLCAPYQGKIYSLSGQSADYPALSSTSYGEAAGLFGCNCGHQMYPYIPGVSEPAGTKILAKENADAYETSQQQRALERNIRRARRNLDVMDALGDPEATQKAKARLAYTQSAMKDFIEETGRTRRRDRETIHE